MDKNHISGSAFLGWPQVDKVMLVRIDWWLGWGTTKGIVYKTQRKTSREDHTRMCDC